MPVNLRSPLIDISPTDRWSGNVLPSRRRPVTSRPVPMILAAPVWRYAIEIPVVLVVIRRRHQHLDVTTQHFRLRVAE